MQECRWIPERELPPSASLEQIAQVRDACQKARARLGWKAQNHATRIWLVHESQIRGAIVRHIDAGRRVFRKHETGGRRRLLPNNLHANVNLDEDRQIYVEFVMMQNQTIIINAHEHECGVARLPQ